MRIRMLTAIAGIRWSASAGDEVEMDDATAHRLIAAGSAEPLLMAPETAVMKQPEMAVTRRQRNAKSRK